MNLVVDTNRIIASLIKNSVARRILTSQSLHFYAPEYSIIEIEKYEELIRNKGNFTHNEFETLLAILLDSITIVPQDEYRDKLSQARKYIEDADDVVFIAVALAKYISGIWTDDAHFHSTEYYIVYRTKDLLFTLKE